MEGSILDSMNEVRYASRVDDIVETLRDYLTDDERKLVMDRVLQKFCKNCWQDKETNKIEQCHCENDE